jgi:hypothetical protein
LPENETRLVLTYQGTHQNPTQLASRDRLPTVEQLWQLSTEQRIQLGQVARMLWTQSFLEMSTSEHCETPDRFGEVFDTLTRETHLVRLVPTSADAQYESFDSTCYAVFVAETKTMPASPSTSMATSTESSLVENVHVFPPCRTLANHASMLPAMPTKCDKRVEYALHEKNGETPTPVFDYTYRIQLHGAYDRLCKLYVTSPFPPLRASLDVVATIRRGQKLECFTMLSHERTYRPTYWEKQRRQAYQGNSQVRFWPLTILHEDTPLPLRYLQHVTPTLVRIFVDVHVTWLTNIRQPPMLLYQVDEAPPDDVPPAWVEAGAYPVHVHTEQTLPIEKSLVFQVRSD